MNKLNITGGAGYKKLIHKMLGINVGSGSFGKVFTYTDSGQTIRYENHNLLSEPKPEAKLHVDSDAKAESKSDAKVESKSDAKSTPEEKPDADSKSGAEDKPYVGMEQQHYTKAIDVERRPNVHISFWTSKQDGYVVKQFLNEDEYLDEKHLFIKKLSIFCGVIYLHSRKYSPPNTLIKYDIIYEKLTSTISISDETHELITYINSLHPLSVWDIKAIHIVLDTQSKNTEYNIYGNGDEKFIIGTLVKDVNEYHVYIDMPRSMRLLYYDDESFALYYKNFGESLNSAYRIWQPSSTQRICLCIDLIRQVNELIKMGIHHSDLKNQNVVIKRIGNNFYLTIIDYGLAITNTEISRYYKKSSTSSTSSTSFTYNTTASSYSPEFLLINKLIKSSYIQNGVLYPFLNLIHLFNTSLHWIIGGICIDILKWGESQSFIFDEYIGYNEPDSRYILYNKYDTAKSDQRAGLRNYISKMLECIPSHDKLFIDNSSLVEEKSQSDATDQAYKNLYTKLVACIENLLHIDHTEKELLSVHFDRLNISPYTDYYRQRQLTRIDF